MCFASVTMTNSFFALRSIQSPFRSRRETCPVCNSLVLLEREKISKNQEDRSNDKTFPALEPHSTRKSKNKSPPALSYKVSVSECRKCIFRHHNTFVNENMFGNGGSTSSNTSSALLNTLSCFCDSKSDPRPVHVL